VSVNACASTPSRRSSVKWSVHDHESLSLNGRSYTTCCRFSRRHPATTIQSNRRDHAGVTGLWRVGRLNRDRLVSVSVRRERLLRQRSDVQERMNGGTASCQPRLDRRVRLLTNIRSRIRQLQRRHRQRRDKSEQICSGHVFEFFRNTNSMPATTSLRNAGVQAEPAGRHTRRAAERGRSFSSATISDADDAGH